MTVTLETPKTDAPLVPVQITVEYDDDYQPWGEPDIVAWEYEQINAHNYAAYNVTVRAVGPVESEDSRGAGLVALTDVGTYEDTAAIPDAHLREVAQDMVNAIRENYLSELRKTREEIDTLISQLEQGHTSA